MEKLIATLLHYATVGQQPTSPEKVEMTSVVEAVLTTLQPAIQEVNAQIRYQELPNVTGDRVLLQQLIQNLVSNALKYRNANQLPHVWIAAEEREGQWLISVSDNGPGISHENQNGVFAPFKRLHGREIPGTGMGLAVCKRIVERHGGRIWVESEPGRGATFLFTLFGHPSSSALDTSPTTPFGAPSKASESGPESRPIPSEPPAVSSGSSVQRGDRLLLPDGSEAHIKGQSADCGTAPG